MKTTTQLLKTFQVGEYLQTNKMTTKSEIQIMIRSES